MTGRDPLSVHRSLQLYLSVILAEPWDVQPVRKEPQTRPLAVVRPVGPAPSTGSAYVREYEQPYEIFVYPLGVEGNPWGSEVEARRVMDTILRAFDSGAGTGKNRGYALRVPLFDYSAIPDDGNVPLAQQPIDYLVLRSPTGEARPDPEADDLFVVMIDFRVNWRNDGDTRRFAGTILEEIPVQGGVP